MKLSTKILIPLSMALTITAMSLPSMAKTTEIKFWSVFGMQPHKKVLETLFDKFEKENPGIKVTAVVPATDGNAYFEKLLTSVAGGISPDVAWVAPERVSGLYDDCIVPVSELMKVGGQIDASGFYKGLWSTKSSYKHNHWGIPFENSNLGLVYNKNMFAAAGIGQPPKTWEEMTQTAIKLTSKEKRTFGLEARYWDWYFPMWLAQKGTGFTDDNGTKITWTEKPAMQAVQWFTDLAVRYQAAGGSFTGQKAAMSIVGTFEYPTLKQSKVNFGVAPLPVATGGTPATFATYKELLVFKNKNKAKIAASWKLIKFLMQDKNFAEWCAPTYYLPVMKSQAKTDIYQKHLAANPGLDVFLDQSDYAYYSPIIKSTRTVWASFQSAVDQIVTGKKTVEQALTEAAKKAQPLLKK